MTSQGMQIIESTEFLKYSFFNLQFSIARETDCENRLNMLDTAQKVNSKVVGGLI